MALTDEIVLNEVTEAMDFENGNKYLKELIKLYLSEKQSLSYSLDQVELQSNEKTIISDIQNKKGYYSYQSNVMVKMNNSVRDEKDISDYLLESSLSPKIEYFFTLPKDVPLFN